MAKKKNGDKTTGVREAEAGAEQVGAEQIGAVDATATDAAGAEEAEATAAESSADAETIVEAATPAFTADEANFLVAEVQSFLNKRGELAVRLAREIEATERRLEELKRTAALLSPAPAAAPVEPAKPEKKAKKPTLKKVEKKAERKLEFADDAGAPPQEAAAASDSTDDSAGPANSQASEELAA